MALLITILYFALVLGISIYISKNNNKSIKDYLVAQSGLGLVAIIPMMFSELIAGTGTIGNAGTAYGIGIASVWMNWGVAIGCLLTVVAVNKFYRVMSIEGNMSVAEAFNWYFDEKTRYVMMGITVLVYTIIFSLQPIAAAGIISPMLNVSSKPIIWFVGISFIIIAALGGLKGIAKVNFIHAFVMYFGLSIAGILAVKYVGGISTISTTVPESYFNLMSPGLLTVIAWIIGAAVNVPAGSMVAGVVFGAKSLKTANRGMIIASLLIIPFAVLVSLLGISAKSYGLDIGANNAIYAITNEISPVLAGVSSMAILAAILSTAPIMLMMIGGTLTRDFYKGLINKNATSDQQLMFTRVSIVVVGIVGILLGMNSESLLLQLLGALQIRSVAGLILVIALLWKRVNNNSAFWGMALGGIVAAVWFFADKPFGIEPLWPSLLVGFSVLVPMTLLSKEKEYAGYTKYKEKLKEYEKEL